MYRTIESSVTGYRTQDGAGVSLVRVLGNETAETCDPFLMLDAFDSTNPDDYTAGFPMHPHRGIETVSYIYRGKMVHRDSLGNEDAISDGEVQWMTAGSGILHEEQLPPSERMLGVQLWLNLPAKDKMTPPAYRSIKNADIETIDLPGGRLRLLAGRYEGHTGVLGSHLPLDFYDIHLEAGTSADIPVDPDRTVILFTLQGDARVGGRLLKAKTAARLTAGDAVRLESADGQPAQILFISSRRLNEPIACGGPIVMNTPEALQQAFDELRSGTFLKAAAQYGSDEA